MILDAEEQVGLNWTPAMKATLGTLRSFPLLNKVWTPPQHLSPGLNSISHQIRNLTCSNSRKSVWEAERCGVAGSRRADATPFQREPHRGSVQPQVGVSLDEIRTVSMLHGTYSGCSLRTKVSW